jgi:hypothetical protein
VGLEELNILTPDYKIAKMFLAAEDPPRMLRWCYPKLLKGEADVIE